MRNDDIVLSTGKSIYANRTMVGINLRKGLEPTEFVLSEGYDGEIWLTKYNSETNDYEPAFTKNELLELTDLVVARWIQFREAILKGEVEAK